MLTTHLILQRGSPSSHWFVAGDTRSVQQVLQGAK